MWEQFIHEYIFPYMRKNIHLNNNVALKILILYFY